MIKKSRNLIIVSSIAAILLYIGHKYLIFLVWEGFEASPYLLQGEDDSDSPKSDTPKSDWFTLFIKNSPSMEESAPRVETPSREESAPRVETPPREESSPKEAIKEDKGKKPAFVPKKLGPEDIFAYDEYNKSPRTDREKDEVRWYFEHLVDPKKPIPVLTGRNRNLQEEFDGIYSGLRAHLVEIPDIFPEKPVSLVGRKSKDGFCLEALSEWNLHKIPYDDKWEERIERGIRLGPGYKFDGKSQDFKQFLVENRSESEILEYAKKRHLRSLDYPVRPGLFKEDIFIRSVTPSDGPGSDVIPGNSLYKFAEWPQEQRPFPLPFIDTIYFPESIKSDGEKEAYLRRHFFIDVEGNIKRRPGQGLVWIKRDYTDNDNPVYSQKPVHNIVWMPQRKSRYR
jgi:hypothetical protein